MRVLIIAVLLLISTISCGETMSCTQAIRCDGFECTMIPVTHLPYWTVRVFGGAAGVHNFHSARIIGNMLSCWYLGKDNLLVATENISVATVPVGPYWIPTLGPADSFDCIAPNPYGCTFALRGGSIK